VVYIKGNLPKAVALIVVLSSPVLIYILSFYLWLDVGVRYSIDINIFLVSSLGTIIVWCLFVLSIIKAINQPNENAIRILAEIRKIVIGLSQTRKNDGK